MILSDEERILLQRVHDVLTELHPYTSKTEKLKKDKNIWHSVERLFIKAGEAMKRFRDKQTSIYNSIPIFKGLARFRDVLAHRIKTDVEKVISGLSQIPNLKDEIERLLIDSSYSNTTLSNFETFGGVGTHKERQRFIDALLDKIKGEKEDKISFPQGKGIKDYSDAVNQITDNSALQKLASENEEVATQITEDIVKWTKETNKSIQRNNPFFKEEELLEKVQEYTGEEFVSSLRDVKKILEKKYSKEEIDFSFYESKAKAFDDLPNAKKALKYKINDLSNGKIPKNASIKKILDSTEFQKIEEEFGGLDEFYEKYNNKIARRKESLRKTFLKDWSGLLQKKKLDYELAQIDKARKKFTEELYKKIEEFNYLKECLEPFTNDLGRLWDMSNNTWRKTGFELLKRYAELLKKDKDIQELAELLGRFRKTDKEYEEEIFKETIIKPEWKIEPAQKSELVGIRESDDLSSLLGSEVALLSEPLTEPIFYKKYVEKKLLTFEYQSRSLQYKQEQKENKRNKAKETDKGPIIICVDTSGSMHGTPEQVAKMLCFAILKIANQDKRKCYLISFSTKIKTLNLTDIKSSIEKLIDFLGMSFHGGTDASPALQEALKMLDTNNYEKADVLLISDFVMPTPNKEIVNGIKNEKTKDCHFHSLTIGNTGNKTVFNEFDHNWIYNPNNPKSLIELVKSIKAINR